MFLSLESQIRSGMIVFNRFRLNELPRPSQSHIHKILNQTSVCLLNKILENQQHRSNIRQLIMVLETSLSLSSFQYSQL